MKGLVLDYGGVLTTNVFDSFRAFCVEEGLDPDAVKSLFRADPQARLLVRAVETGDIREDDFSERVGALLGVADRDGLIDRLFGGMGPDEAMLAAVKRARGQGISTGLISNSMGEGRYDRGAFGELFDGVVISGEVGLHKPQPEIFLLGCERIGLAPEECVFVDDLRENCEGAEAVGMTAILHRDPAESVKQIEELFGISVPV